jgi:NADH-quinone oxidoreductase subunit H
VVDVYLDVYVNALFSILVFPGTIFLVALAFFTQYLVRKLSARYQRRMGPSYVGPIGLLQPFYDFLKLLRAKEEVVNRFSMPRLAEFALIIGVSCIVSSVIFLPISLLNVATVFDVLIFFYLSSVMPLFAMVIASLSMPSPYTNIGVSRLLSLVTIAEPAYFASILVPVYLATRGDGLFMSISSTYVNFSRLYSNPITLAILALSIIGFTVSIQVKAMYPPFNIPEAEQEIIAGYETEFSGPLLALARLLHDLDLVIALVIGVYVLLGGPAPFNHLSPLGGLVLVLKYLILLLLVVTLKNIMGRYRIDQALVQVFKYGLIPPILAAILALVAP